MGQAPLRTKRREREAAADMTARLVALTRMTTAELAEKYEEVFGAPTRTRNKAYLRKRVAWRIQELVEGGLSERALARIEELAPLAPVRWRQRPGKQASVAGADSAAPRRDPRLPEPGTVITRTHGGKEHKVKVLADGFEYRRKRHRSLSRVAREITGTAWNGFAFFGLQARAAPNGTQVSR